MTNQLTRAYLIIVMALVIVGCVAQPASDSEVVFNTPTSAPENVPPEATPTTESPPTPTSQPEAVTPPQEGQLAQVDADRNTVEMIRAGERLPLAANERDFLNEGDGVDVDENGRAILRFADLLSVEVLRDGELTIQQLPPNGQSALITVLENGGTFLNNFNPQEAIDKRLTITTDFATIEATGTEFLVVSEAHGELEWILGMDASAQNLTVESANVTKGVETGQARWIASIDEPSPGIGYDQQAVTTWLQNVQSGQQEQEIGEVLWPHADYVTDTAPLPDPIVAGQVYQLGQVEFTPAPGGQYANRDCNGDGIVDVEMWDGNLAFDFRQVIARIRGLDVTIFNLDQPGSGGLTMFNPSRQTMSTVQVTVGPNQGEVLSRRSADVPYHYAELAMTHGCFLGLSLTPPDEAPRPGTPDYQTLITTGRPPQNGLVRAVSASAYQNSVTIDGDLADWQALAQASGQPWTPIEAIVFNPACADGYADGSGTDLRGQVFFAYNPDSLYVAFQVEDDSYVYYQGADERFFLGDAPQLLLDLDLQGDFDDINNSADDIQIDIHPGLRTPGTNPRAALWTLAPNLESRLLQEAQIAASPIQGGYFVETAIPWRVLGLEPETELAIGVAASVSDNDTANTETQECMVSTAPNRDWQNPTTWGMLVLE